MFIIQLKKKISVRITFGLVTQNSSIIGMECTVLKVRLQTVNAVYQIVLITIAVDLVHHDWFTVLHDV